LKTSIALVITNKATNFALNSGAFQARKKKKVEKAKKKTEEKKKKKKIFLT
jgi:hypothetical protein